MTDDESPRDDLLQPSLSGVALETSAPYNLFCAIVPGIIGGPPAVTIAMALISWQLRASKAVMGVIIAIGVAAFVAAAVVIHQESHVTSGSVFRVAAVITYAAQFPLLVRRFRSWQLRGKDIESFVGPGIGLAIGGAFLCALIGAYASAGERFE